MADKMVLHPEEENVMKDPAKYKYLTGIASAKKSDMRNIIASVIENKEEVYVKLEWDDCIGLRGVIVRVFMDSSGNNNLGLHAESIRKKLEKYGYSVSERPLSVSDEKCHLFRTSECPIEKEK